MALRAAWGYLALVLLLAPMLGLMHGLVHGAIDSHHAAPAHLAQADDSSHAHSWLADLFSAHADDSDCRVYDQLCHADAALVPPLAALPMVLSAFVFLFLQGEALARRAALFEARGPPLTR
ncbi:hypothetical protein [Polaromonas sp.]|uniref:hypothetical protein n=1 Tax=Polaromonas sp. TaxID=1869339 RepID=UPI00273696F7|nr:hypothetical protein [Polaromonas sp.]